MFSFFKKFLPFVKYCVVGAIGTAVDVGALYALVEYAHWTLFPATTAAFLAAVVNNYTLNKIWTFRHRSSNHRKLFLKFMIVSCTGLGLTNALMFVFVLKLGIWYVSAKVLTSGFVFLWNFLANQYWTFRLEEYDLGIPARFSHEFSIIVPAYNEERRIASTLETIGRYVRARKLDAEIIVVDDGSTDGTRGVIEERRAEAPNLTIIHYRQNMGKGFAVRRGVRASHGRYILFTDADNSTPIEELEKLAAPLRAGVCDIAVGSRYLRSDSVKVAQPLLRIALGRAGNWLIRMFLIEGVRDTQCGFKMFAHRAAKEIFARQKVIRWGFDMEALAVGKALGYRIQELAVSWHDVPGSRFRPIRDAIRTFWELIYIKVNFWSGRYR